VTEKQLETLYEIHSDLPREAPGSAQSTHMAFASISDLPRRPVILDIGCGSGAQTLAIAKLIDGRIYAVDSHRPFIERLEKDVRQTGQSGRIIPSVADMNDLPFDADTFDLIWAEGSIYFIGIKRALELWKPLLKENGHIAFTEMSWFRKDLPGELRAFWNEEYPAMTFIAGNVELIADAGFELVRRFNLPESDWWDNYYNPILNKMPALRTKYKDDPEVLEVLARQELEIDLYRRFSKCYGYVFYVARRLD